MYYFKILISQLLHGHDPPLPQVFVGAYRRQKRVSDPFGARAAGSCELDSGPLHQCS